MKERCHSTSLIGGLLAATGVVGASDASPVGTSEDARGSGAVAQAAATNAPIPGVHASCRGGLCMGLLAVRICCGAGLAVVPGDACIGIWCDGGMCCGGVVPFRKWLPTPPCSRYRQHYGILCAQAAWHMDRGATACVAVHAAVMPGWLQYGAGVRALGQLVLRRYATTPQSGGNCGVEGG